MEPDPAQVVREIELDAAAEDVWAVVSDPDELAGWVGDEVRQARFAEPDEPDLVGGPGPGPGAGAGTGLAAEAGTGAGTAAAPVRRLQWIWAPEGHESSVELTVTEVGPRTLVRVVERTAVASAALRSTSRWEDAMLVLERWALCLALAVRA